MRRISKSIRCIYYNQAVSPNVAPDLSYPFNDCHHQRQRQEKAGRNWRARGAVASSVLVCGAIFFQTRTDPTSNAAKLTTSGTNSIISYKAEYHTGTKFPSQIRAWLCEDQTCHHTTLELVNIGLRCMLGLCQITQARAYAIGLYIDPVGAAAALAANPKETSFEKVVFNNKFGKALRLVFVADVKGSHVSAGFAKSFGKRLEKYTTNDPKAKQGLKQILAIFDSLSTVRAGTEVIFTWGNDGLILQIIPPEEGGRPINKNITVIENSSIPRTIFETYCGESPVSGGTKKSFVKGWNRFVQSHSK